MSVKGTKILVTGASGFIGQHVVRVLLERGCEIYGISRSREGTGTNGVHWCSADLTDPKRISDIVATVKPARIIHLASMVSGDRRLDLVLPMMHANLLSAVSLLVAAARSECERVLLAGSMEEPVPSQTTPTPGSPYAAAKWAASGYARMFHALYGVSTVVLRIFMVYGPGQNDYAKLAPYVVRSLLQGRSPQLGGGARAVDWVFVEDLAEGIVRACFSEGIGGKTIDLGSGKMVSIKDFVSRLGSAVDPSIPLNFGAIPDRPLELEPCADVASTEALLGWRATTPLDEGFERTIRWYREHLIH